MVNILVSAFLFVMLLFPASGLASCLICHSAMEGRMEGSKGVVDVHIDVDKFGKSVHGAVECADCHLTYSQEAHTLPAQEVPEDVASIVPFISAKSKIDPVAQSACYRCHPQVYDDYRGSVHGQNIFIKRESDGPVCLDCHGSPHYIVPASEKESRVNHANLLHTCGGCHEDEKLVEKYELGTQVIEKYKESFHGKKYILGHTKVPICSDCHGSHAIVKADDPNSPVVGEGKVKTCGKCHKGATAKFAAAPAHKYIGKDNPIPYYGEKLLIILLLGVFAFVVSHVLLEAFSEIRDKVLKKEEEHHE